MNIPYLAKCLETDKLSDLVAVIDLVPLDMNLALEDSVSRGEIKIDRERDYVEVVAKDVASWYQPELTSKILRTIQHYAANNTNITRGRMNALVKDPMGQIPGYPTHEYIMSMQHLVDSGQVLEYVVDVPAEYKKNAKGKITTKVKRPAHKFVFIGLPENDHKNTEWNNTAVNNWIATFDKVK